MLTGPKHFLNAFGLLILSFFVLFSWLGWSRNQSFLFDHDCHWRAFGLNDTFLGDIFTRGNNCFSVVVVLFDDRFSFFVLDGLGGLDGLLSECRVAGGVSFCFLGLDEVL